MNSETTPQRHIGLVGATGVGVGAIVGGGILALAGVAFSTTGPAALLAFALNGLIALLTALSFAEIASRFPESGGTYAFSKKVLSVEVAFTVGWVVWFASVVAAALYAIGFAHFTMLMLGNIWQALGGTPAVQLMYPSVLSGVAAVTTLAIAASMMFGAVGSGRWANAGKVLVFGVLVAAGLLALVRQPIDETSATLRPFFTAGFGGLIQAMGYTFIALQGFDLIAAVGGEIRQPAKTIPRATLLSLGIALAIYLPFLFVIITVGNSPGESIAEKARQDPEGIVAIAVRNYLGSFGYWLVIIAAILSMFSALHANLFAASRIVRAMARDRTLPAPLSGLSKKHGTPVAAISITAVLVCVILVVLPDVAKAGAAASLIFLVTFALAHWLAILVRQRSKQRPPFCVPLFPAVPVVGGLACLALAVFQGVAVPSAGTIAAVWLCIGSILFLALFANRARVVDASTTALDPELFALRGTTPLVLVPIANPENAPAMIALAHALAPADIGRVLLQTVIVAPYDWQPDDDPAPAEKAQRLLYELLRASANAKVGVEALTTVAPQPMKEIARVARLHRCECILMGLSRISGDTQGTPLESLLSLVDSDVVVLRARKDWKLEDVNRILIPVAGKGRHDYLLARLLGSLLRTGDRQVTFLRMLPTSATNDDVRRARRDLKGLAKDNVRGRYEVEVLQTNDPAMALTGRAEEFDLLILGVQRHSRRKKLFGGFIRRVANETSCPIVAISRRG